MPKNLETGKSGEDLACKYLVDNFYEILGRNARQKFGEIDIISRTPDKTLVFVEVKTMTDVDNGLSPEDQMTFSKLKKIKKTCEFYAGRYPELVNDKKGWRIDLITIKIPKNNLNDPKIEHYQNIF